MTGPGSNPSVSVDGPAMRDAYDENDECRILNLVHYAVNADAEAPKPAETSLQGTARMGMLRQSVDGIHDSHAVVLRNPAKRLDRAPLNPNGVGHP